MEEQAFRRLPPRLRRARAQVSVDARIQEPDDPRHAGDRHRSDRVSRSGRPVRREGGGTGPAAADHAGGRQRGVRRRRRARRSRCRSRRRRSCARCRRRRAGKPARDRPGGVPEIAWPEPLLVAPPWEGGDGRASNDAEAARDAKADAGVEATAGGARMMRLPPFHYRAPRDGRRGRRVARRSSRRHDAARRRHRPVAEHEAAAADARDARRPAYGIDELSRRHERRRAHDRRRRRRCSASSRRRARSRVTTGPVAGRGAGRHAASAQHGDARRQPLPRHPLHLLRPELRVAAGDRLLHEEGRRHLLGRDVEPDVPRGLVHRHGADAAGARRARHARVSRRRARHRRRRVSTRTTACTT